MSAGGVEHLMFSGPLLLAMPVAAAAGAITFLSPCVLPLVPGYLSYVTGMSGAVLVRGDDPVVGGDNPPDPPDRGAEPPGAPKPSARAGRPALAAGTLAGSAPGDSAPEVASPGNSAAGEAGLAAGTLAGSAPGDSAPEVTGPADADTAAAARRVAVLEREAGGRQAGRGQVVAGAALFVLGFSALFATFGLAFGSIGTVLRAHEQGLTQLLGCVIIAMGLLFAGAFDRFSFAGRIVKPSVRPRAGLVGAPLLGVLFGLGWTPCIGPTLTAVLTLGATTGGAARGALLAFVYGLGLGIPFLLVAFTLERGVRVFGFARRHARWISRIGGLMLIAVGLLEVTGAWSSAVAWLQVHWVSGYTAPL
jgi:cytochrome c-type biogenesis protein